MVLHCRRMHTDYYHCNICLQIDPASHIVEPVCNDLVGHLFSRLQTQESSTSRSHRPGLSLPCLLKRTGKAQPRILLFCQRPHRSPLIGDDEPKLLLYAILLICPISADVRHLGHYVPSGSPFQSSGVRGSRQTGLILSNCFSIPIRILLCIPIFRKQSC